MYPRGIDPKSFKKIFALGLLKIKKGIKTDIANKEI